MARKLYTATEGDPKPAAKAFLDFIASPAGQGIAKTNGFMPARQMRLARRLCLLMESLPCRRA